MKLFSGSSNLPLAEGIAESLHSELSPIELLRYSDGEIGVHIDEPILRQDVLVIQTCSHPVNDHLMELLIMVDAFRRGGARSITAVVPLLAYSRKEKKDNRQDPISGKLVANLLQVAGIDRLISLDLHADAVEGFFDVPVVNVSAVRLFAKHFKSFAAKDLVVVAPDMGGAKRARRLAKELDVPVVILEKIRPSNSPHSDVVSMIGDVSGKDALIVDDIISSGGTLINAASILKEKGARKVLVCASHPILADNAVANLDKSEIAEVVVTDSVPLQTEQKSKKIKIISVAFLLAQEINRLII